MKVLAIASPFLAALVALYFVFGEVTWLQVLALSVMSGVMAFRSAPDD